METVVYVPRLSSALTKAYSSEVSADTRSMHCSRQKLRASSQSRWPPVPSQLAW
jgi:hypothetical protein